MPSTLFVCTANLFRSPLACAFLRRNITQSVYYPTWRIESAGTWAAEGLPAAGEAQRIAQEYGMDLSAHRTRSVNVELMHSFKLILTMEQGQQEALQIEFPDAADRVYMLSEMAGVRANVLDPAPGSAADCRRVVREIEEWLRLGYSRIIDLALGYPAARRSRSDTAGRSTRPAEPTP